MYVKYVFLNFILILNTVTIKVAAKRKSARGRGETENPPKIQINNKKQ